MNLSQTAILKWTFYALAAAALFFLRRLFLGSMTFFGVLPLPAARRSRGHRLV